MEAGRILLSPPPPPPPPPSHLSRSHQLRSTSSSSSSSSVLALHDQASHALTSAPSSIMLCYPASVSSKEQRDDCKIYAIKEEKLAQAALYRHHMEDGRPVCDEKEQYHLNQYLKYLKRQLHFLPGLCSEPENTIDKPSIDMPVESTVNSASKVADNKIMQAEKNISTSLVLGDALALAKRAMMASREAASLSQTKTFADDLNESHLDMPGLDPHGPSKDIFIKGETTVRSKKLLERQLKKRKVPKKPTDANNEVPYPVNAAGIRNKIDKSLDSSDPLRFFLWGPETKQLLTLKEEKELFVKIQDLMKLEEVKQRLELQFNREPTIAEWAQAVEMSCPALRSCQDNGRRSREKMIYSNFLLVVHVAKQYEGKGLNLQDLLQEGSKGLIKSVGKFKPKIGCRFSTYAYWWIRQSIRKAIFQHSRTIRLPENVFALLKKVKTARRLCIQEGKIPTHEELAERAGISTQKLASLLLNTKDPRSIQESVWADQGVSFQEITADPRVEIPDLSISKKMMRLHARNLLMSLPTRERQIIQLRFGIHDNEPKSLTEIGVIFGISKERVRQLESRALNNLKSCLQSQGLGAYVEMLT